MDDDDDDDDDDAALLMSVRAGVNSTLGVAIDVDFGVAPEKSDAVSTAFSPPTLTQQTIIEFTSAVFRGCVLCQCVPESGVDALVYASKFAASDRIASRCAMGVRAMGVRDDDDDDAFDDDSAMPC